MQPSEFRQQYRREAIGPRYSGWAHFAFTSLGCLAVIAFSLSRLDSVQPLEWLAVPLTFVYANIAEWAGHRGVMHRPRRGFGLIFRRHTHQHHVFFTPEQMQFGGPRDFKAVLFPPVLLVFFVLAFAVPAGALIAWLLGANVAWLFVATAVGYFLNYEWLHFAYHAPDGHWLRRLPGLDRLRQLHLDHHRPALMSHRNFNITYPIADRLFGTYHRGNESS